ncbi:response regulator transcription factor [Thermoanaerobacterium thermosaccharolyticum]|nr:response regulator transcription factor [Thermoanaerobacterium thermosaccharolyticum]MBE0229518.1 response regulator transcription factor [Thermoanaerobacterium thermosaccharolyticum]
MNIVKGVKKMFLMETKLDYLDILILSSLVRNGSRKVVANDVGISERTLRRHIKKLYTLLNVQNDIKLALAAINAGIVDSYGNILT